MLSDDPNNNSLGEFTPQFQKSVQVYFLSRSSFGGVLVPILFLCVIPILIWMAFESIFHTSYGAANSGRNTCGLEEDGFSVLYTYVAVPTIGCAGATLTTQALNMLTIEHGDRVKVMRLSVVVISLIAITQQTIWISNPPLSICDLEPRAISVLILATEYFVTTPLLLYMNLALDPFKDKLVREDYYIICSSVAAVLFFFASNVASHSHTGPHGDVHSLMTISGRAYMNGTAENPMLVLLLLASAGILFVYSLAATLRQSYRTYQVALIGTKMGASQVRVTGGKDVKGTDSGSLMVEVAMKASTRKLYLAVFLCAMYVPAGVFYFMVATGRLRYMYGVRLEDGGSLAILSGASFFTKHLYCLLLLAFHSHMMHPNKLAHAAEERANGSRRAFLKYVFMEVRVPLNSIIMSLQILDHDEAVPEGSRETVAMMREAAQFMAQTLNDVFSMQKIEEGTFDIEYGECEVDAMLRTASNSMQGQLAAKNITLVLEKKPGVPPYVLADRGRLEHVLVNMVSNAIKFSPPKEKVHVEVSALTSSVLLEQLTQQKVPRNSGGISSSSSSGGGGGEATTNKSACNNAIVLKFTVRDRGVGVRLEDQDKLFQAYSQIRPGELQGGRGTGVGLAICKQIIAKHNGDIGMRSNPAVDVGSDFYFSIPVWVITQRLGVDSNGSTTTTTTTAPIRGVTITPTTATTTAAAATTTTNASTITNNGTWPPEVHSQSIRGPLGPHTTVIITDASSGERSVLVPSTAAGTPSDEEHMSAASSESSDRTGFREMRVLVTDDVYSNRRLLSLLLRKQFGFAAEEASSGLEALKKVRAAQEAQRPFEIIFLDNVMPGLNGVETAALLRGGRPSTVLKHNPDLLRLLLLLLPGIERDSNSEGGGGGGGGGWEQSENDSSTTDITNDTSNENNATTTAPPSPFKHTGLIVGLTGNVMEDDLAEFVRAGADLALAKPVKAKLLEGLVRHVDRFGPGSTRTDREDVIADVAAASASAKHHRVSERLLSLAAISETPLLDMIPENDTVAEWDDEEE